MALDPEKKKEIINEFQIHENDTGSVEVQIALLTARIKHLTEHLKKAPQGLSLQKRPDEDDRKKKETLEVFETQKPEVYRELIAKLGIRK